MLKRTVVPILLIAPFVCVFESGALAADPAKDTLVSQIRDSIDKGIQYLRSKEAAAGGWEIDPACTGYSGGWTALAMLALLNAGVKPDDPIIDRGLEILRAKDPQKTYVVGLQTMVFATAGRKEDAQRIQRNVDWLIDARVMEGNELRGWTYTNRLAGNNSDNSNTQYALLGLHEGRRAGAKIDRQIWQSIRDYYIRTQEKDGGWHYGSHYHRSSNLTMTTAGLSGLLIASLELNDTREKPLADGSWDSCGEYQDDAAILRAIEWIKSGFRTDPREAVYYNLYGLERAGRLTGRRFFGEHDWYREGCEYLLKKQKDEGYWKENKNHDDWPVISTSFALLFLSKGRTPVLISKLTHEPAEDWNNDRNDARHLVEFVSRELFKRQPLAWQVFDAKRGLAQNTAEERLTVVGDLLESPIVYFNGHRPPQFTNAEESILKQYVEHGGFILAEACCGRRDFDAGFRDLMTRLFPDMPLKPLGPEHPIWKAYYPCDPAEFPLEGIEMGCKTVIVYSPRDLSCYWESNRYEERDVSQRAFRLGGNIVAYATGMELPKPRLSKVEVFGDQTDDRKVPRGYLKVAQLRHEGDWQPAPRAMPNLMLQMRQKQHLDVSLQTEPVRPTDKKLLNYKFLYMHGRSAFTFSKNELENLRADLQTGGILLADACCGKQAFDTAFRDFATKIFPDKKLERIPLTDPLFGKELNGEAITTVRCRRELADGKGADANYREVQPYMEGIKVGDRWAVIYSKYDLGCALEKHPSTDCLGHDFASAVRLGSAVVLYAIKR